MPVINSVLNNTRLKHLFIFCAVLLSACNTTKSINTFIPAAVKADQAVVYIYRPITMTNALHSPGLTIDDEFKLYLKNGSNTRLSLNPGKHQFEFQPEKKYSKLTPVSFKLDAGNNYYIRVNTSLKLKSNEGYQPYERNFGLTQVVESLAIKEIAECCLTNDKKTNDIKIKTPDDKQTDEGFSVDKTQSPFSH